MMVDIYMERDLKIVFRKCNRSLLVLSIRIYSYVYNKKVEESKIYDT